jgi:hypothetical protein
MIGATTSSFRLALSDDSAYKPGTNTWTTNSDARLKESIEFANSFQCYETLKRIPLRRYRWKDAVSERHQFRDKTRLGWIAQEVEPFFPKAVDTYPYLLTGQNRITEMISDCKTLNTDQLYATMYGAIQHLIQRQEELESTICGIRSMIP